jgi:hypothetical protein
MVMVKKGVLAAALGATMAFLTTAPMLLAAFLIDRNRRSS